MNNCPTCQSPIKTIPAGVSKKTGRPYDAFQVCSNRDCNWKPQRPAITSKVQAVTQMQENKARLINQAMDRKEESISKFNALNAAINLVCHHPSYRNMLNEEQILEKVFALQLRFFTHNGRSLEYDVNPPDEPLPSEY